MATRTDIAKLYVATFNRAADAAGLAYWISDGTASTTSLTDMDAIAAAMLQSPEASSMYAGLSREDTVIKMYDNIFNRTVDATDAGIMYWTSGAGSSVADNEMVNALVNGALGNDSTTINNKGTVGLAFADAGLNDVAQAISVMQDVNADATTVTSATNSISAFVGNGNTIYLSNGQDILSGTSGNDTFVARGNSSLDNADIIDGGAGTDTVTVMLDNGETAESPSFTNIEVLKVQGQTENVDTGDNQVTGFQSDIDAGDMKDVQEYWSEDSRSDVTIEGIERNSNSTTINWTKSDSGDVDYTALFYHPTDAGTTEDGATLTLDLVNTQALTDSKSALTDNQYQGFKFSLDGVEQIVQPAGFQAATTYAELAAVINTELAALGLTTLTATLGDVTNVYNNDTAALVGTKQAIVIQNSAAGTLTFNDLDAWITDVNAPATNDFSAKMNNKAPESTGTLTQVNVVLDYVGHGSKSGDLLIGNMSNANGITHAGSDGIQQFNTVVDRDSYLSSMSSTANGLESIILTNTGANGNVQIDAIQDVQTLNASAMIGSVNVTADLADTVTAKYMNNVDTATDGSADNIAFNYSLGTNNDTLNLTISSSNLQAAGATSREDFVLTVDGGTGDDTINTSITGAAAVTDATNWYTNSRDNANLTINAGSGNDTVTTTGAGNFVINAEEGNDTVYTDNSGSNAAAWILNADNADLTNLDGNALASNFMYKSTVTVTLSGTNAEATSGVINPDANSNVVGFESSAIEITTDYTADQRTVNQAIKTAINNDAVLSKLIVASDGPGNTLVIDSLIDGTFNTDDLQIEIASHAVNATSSEYNALLTAWRDFNNDSTLATVTSADLAAQVAAYDAANTSYGTTMVMGANGTASVAASDNTINLGAGDDVVVLGTDVNSNDTIVLTGSNFGHNTIVNFVDAANTALDGLDFSSYLTSQQSLSGSTQSTTTFAQTVNTNSSVEANSVTLINNFVSGVNQSWANLSASDLIKAINDDNSDATDAYGSITEGDLDAVNVASLVGSSYKSVIMVENDTNAGEYRVFDVTATDNGDFTSAVLVGTLDFGAELNTASLVVGSHAGVAAAGAAGGALAPVVPPVVGGSTTTTITANGAGDTVSIASFAAGDVIDFPDNGSISQTNTNTSDGIVVLTWNDGGTNDTTVTVNGIAATDDVNLFAVSEWATVFGAGTIA